MNISKIKWLPLASLASIALTSLTAKEAFAFTFTKIADDSASLNFDNVSFGPDPAINDNGRVVFLTNLDTGGEGIFTSDGESITTIATASDTSEFGNFGTFRSSPVINNENTVAFNAFLSTGNPRSFFGGGVFTVRDGVTNFIDVSNLAPAAFLGQPAINDKGTIAISASTSTTSIYTLNDGTPNLVVDSSKIFDSVFLVGINNQGTVSFQGTLDTGSKGIFTINNATITTIADSNSPFDFFLGGSVNNSGAVAFAAFPDFQDFLSGDGGGGIFVNNGGVTTLIVDNTGQFRTFGNPAINDSGNVAFQATLDTGTTGIFTGSNPLVDKVISTGDTLEDSTVTNLSFSRFLNKGLNNFGQIAFYAELADGTRGIFRANPNVPSPKPVPEPTTILGLLLIGGLSASSVLKRNQNQL